MIKPLSALVFGLLSTTALCPAGAQEVVAVPGHIGAGALLSGATHSGSVFPVISFDSGGYIFGSQAVGTSSPPHGFVITNVGSISFPISSISITGANPGDFSQTNTCPGSLSVSANCTINATFTPTAVGSRNASVAVVTTGGRTYTAGVTGTGAPATTCPGGTFTTTQTNTDLNGVCLSTTTGPAAVFNDGGTHTVSASQIGPCGDNNTTNASQCIYITNGTTVNIYDSYIHAENIASNCSPADTHTNIYIFDNGTAPVTIQGNVIAYGQNNIHGWNTTNLHVYGNYLLNPQGSAACSNPDNLQGNQFQSWGDAAMSGNWFKNNYTWSSTTGFTFAGAVSDNVSFGGTSAGLNAGVVATDNWIGVNGGLGVNPTACGLIADTGSTGADFERNDISETYHCGIGLSGGSGITVNSVKILLAVNTEASSAGLVISGARCPISVTNSTVSAERSPSPPTSSSYSQAGYNFLTDSSPASCATPTGITPNVHSFVNNGGGNSIDTGCTFPSCPAYTALNPMATTNPPPLIPPVPFSCTAKSPYSTQTSKPACS